jgi:transposase
MMGRQTCDQSQLFYLFNLEARIPERHLLRRINPIVTRVLTDVRSKLEPLYSDIGRPSIDPELVALGSREIGKSCKPVNAENRVTSGC